MSSVLLLIDIQNDYFIGGRFPLPDMEIVSIKCASLLAKARNNQVPVIHVRHEFPAGEGPFLSAATEGVSIHKTVVPINNEVVITKQFPNAFFNTELNKYLQEIHCDHLVIIGAMTQMCINATTRAALEFGYPVTIVTDAVASQTVNFMNITLDTDQVKAAFLSSLAMAQARLASSDEVITEWS